MLASISVSSIPMNELLLRSVELWIGLGNSSVKQWD